MFGFSLSPSECGKNEFKIKHRMYIHESRQKTPCTLVCIPMMKPLMLQMQLCSQWERSRLTKYAPMA